MIINNKLIFTLFLLILILKVQSKLSVYNYQELDIQDQTLNQITFSIPNFGFVPLGKTIISRLILSPAFSSQCQLNQTVLADPVNKMIENSFLLIPRGQCNFVTKVLNAQTLGAQAAIIMDNQTHAYRTIMADNGYGYKVKIPSIFINHVDGQKLSNLLLYTVKPVIIKITFETNKTNVVDLKFYLQANNRHSYWLVKRFRDYYFKIQPHIKLTIIYDTQSCQACAQADCYFKNKFCALHIIHQQSATGRDLLNQQLRQQIVFNLDKLRWWMYMDCIDNQCSKISQLEQCSNYCLESKVFYSPQQINQKLKETFLPDSNNTILWKNSQLLANSGVTSFPTVSINEIKLKGSLAPEFIMDDICNSLEQPSSVCDKYLTKRIDHNYWPIVIGVTVIGATIFGILFCIYRRYMRRKMKDQMAGRVNDMVSKYIEFYSERNNRQ